MSGLSKSTNAARQAASSLGFGLQPLRRSNSDTTVIFVHGILSDSEAAWGNPSWPSLLLEEEEILGAGVYVFTYRTGLISHTYSVSDATDALREYLSEFDIWKQRRIIFVCHSMGGIVIRRFIVANQARLAKTNPILGLFLVASPSLGSRDANMLSILSYAFSHSQAAILRFSQSNTTLDDLHRDFRTLLDSKILRIVGRELIEDRPIRIKRLFGLWRQVVEPFSASAYFHGEGYEPLKIPGSDHSSIVKPLSRTALQHQALVRFARQSLEMGFGEPDHRPVVRDQESAGSQVTRETTTVEPTPLRLGPDNGTVFQSALSVKLTSGTTMPSDDANLERKAEIALELRAGRMIERMFASALVKNDVNPTAIFMAAAGLASSERQFELIAPWLRWVRDNRTAEEAAKLFEERLQPSWVYKTRMQATMAGWSGNWLFSVVDMSDRYHKEKFAYTYSMAYAHAAWKDQNENALRSIAGRLIDMNRHFFDYYNRDISVFDWLSAMKGIPPGNAKILLNEMVAKKAPSDMIYALLARLCLEPSKGAVPDLEVLIRAADSELSSQAMKALAFIPAQARTIRELKQDLLAKGSIGDVISAAIDLRLDAVDNLGALVSGSGGGELGYYAAWSLGQLAPGSPETRRYLRHGAIEHPDALIRAMCIVGLAASGAAEASQLVEAELADSRDLQKFCLLVARTYTEDITPLLHFLAETSEDRVYVPLLLTCFQRVFCDALRHASMHAPMLNDLQGLSDDP